MFVGAWNEFLFALTLTSREARTLPTVIAEFVGDTGIEWPQIMAASTIALAPVLVATFAFSGTSPRHDLGRDEGLRSQAEHPRSHRRKTERRRRFPQQDRSRRLN